MTLRLIIFFTVLIFAAIGIFVVASTAVSIKNAFSPVAIEQKIKQSVKIPKPARKIIDGIRQR